MFVNLGFLLQNQGCASPCSLLQNKINPNREVDLMVLEILGWVGGCDEKTAEVGSSFLSVNPSLRNNVYQVQSHSKSWVKC